MTVKEKIQSSFETLPVVEGPIEVTETSHPFCAMQYSRVPLDVSSYGYVEEEYFLSGTANVYEADEYDRVIVVKEGLPYKTRILVRRPASRKKFSGRVYVDILNATQGYDIEDLWHRHYLWCMEHGHGYVGLTSKPVNVMSLKNFDYARYWELNWSNGEFVPVPVPSKTATIPGTEEGLVWDMIGQLGMLLRSGGSNNCMDGYEVKYVYLTGQSQSGAYLNTYVSYFDDVAHNMAGHGIFDGYLNVVGALVQRSLRQSRSVGELHLEKRHMKPCATPYICMSSEADLYLFNLFVEGDLFSVCVENVDEPGNKCRYYELPGAPHTDIICPVLTATSEIQQAGGKLPNLDPKLLEHINDMHVEYYVCGLLEKLHRWAAMGEAPEAIEPMIRKEGDLARDEYGNALGGLRTPYVDVPIASYVASNPDDPEGICGKMTYFSVGELKHRYGSVREYLMCFSKCVEEQQSQGWISETDGKKMIDWSLETVKKIL